MKIVKFESGRVSWLFPLEEFVPVAGSHNPSIVSQIAQRYGFTIVPKITTREDMAKNGLPFGMGHFEVDGTSFTVTDFRVYNDGLVAVAEKTDWAEAFLEDVVSWVKEVFPFREISSGIRKLYASTIVVEFESPLSRLLRGHALISELISTRTATITSNKRVMELARLDFDVDKTKQVGELALPKFVLERRAGVSFERERYFSDAPMHSAEHVSVLQEIEKLAATSGG